MSTPIFSILEWLLHNRFLPSPHSHGLRNSRSPVFSIALCLVAVLVMTTMNIPARSESILLWPDRAPAAIGTGDADTPTLTRFPASHDNFSGAAMLILPGGGYAKLAPHEGAGYAEWLAGNGIECFVLKYRLGTEGYKHPVMLMDAARALRFIRSHAAEWGLDSKRIGIMGSSAGGHLASTLLTRFDDGDPSAADPVTNNLRKERHKKSQPLLDESLA